MKYAVVSLESNSVVNIIELDPGSDPKTKWSPPNNHIIIANANVEIGWAYANNALVEPKVELVQSANTTPRIVKPRSVTPLQMRKALNSLGLRKQVEDYVKTLGPDAVDSWEYASVIERDNALIEQTAKQFNKTEEDVDDIFRLASSM